MGFHLDIFGNIMIQQEKKLHDILEFFLIG